MSFYADGSATVVDATEVGKWIQVLTHLVAVVVAIDFWRRREFYALSVTLSVLQNSPLYHICKAGWYCFGLSSSPVLLLGALERLRLNDHVNSTHAAMAVILIIAIGESGGGTHAVAYRLLLYMMTLFAVIAFPYQLKSVVIVFSYLLLIIAVEYLWVRRSRVPQWHRFNLRYVIATPVTAALAIFFYAEPAFIPHEISHGLWHTFVFITLWLAVRAVNDQDSGQRDSVL